MCTYQGSNRLNGSLRLNLALSVFSPLVINNRLRDKSWEGPGDEAIASINMKHACGTGSLHVQRLHKFHILHALVPDAIILSHDLCNIAITLTLKVVFIFPWHPLHTSIATLKYEDQHCVSSSNQIIPALPAVVIRRRVMLRTSPDMTSSSCTQNGIEWHAMAEGIFGTTILQDCCSRVTLSHW